MADKVTLIVEIVKIGEDCVITMISVEMMKIILKHTENVVVVEAAKEIRLMTNLIRPE